MFEISERVRKGLDYCAKVNGEKCKNCPSEKVEKCKNNYTGVIIDGVTIRYGCMNTEQINELNKIVRG